MSSTQNFKCHFCPECLGNGCVGEMPGMGGFDNSINFQLNCINWLHLEAKLSRKGLLRPETEDEIPLPAIRLAPLTGGVENIGYESERMFYFDMLRSAYLAGIKLSIGDGCPDEKLLSGILAIRSLRTEFHDIDRDIKGAVFIKPYPDDKLLERMDWAREVAEIIGVDIDSFNIVTMRNLVSLEQKSAEQLITLKKAAKVPFAIKGIFTRNDIDLVKEVRPDIAVISNHGGRVENRIGSTASFLSEHGEELRNYCGELWVDGGIRRHNDLLAAGYYGVKEVMVGRPFISALCHGGTDEVAAVARKLAH